MIEFNNARPCHTRQLNGLINKINGSNSETIKKQIYNLFDKTEDEHIIDSMILTIIKKSYIGRTYTPFLIKLLKQHAIHNNKYNTKIINNIQEHHESCIDMLDSKIEDIMYLATSNKYDDFCECNKKKQNLVNWGQATLILIKEDLLQFTYEGYFDLIFFKVCEYFSLNDLVNIDVLVDILADFVNNSGIDTNKYRKTISKFYSSNIKQKLNKMCQFKFELLI